jgi:hypothetical protein
MPSQHQWRSDDEREVHGGVEHRIGDIGAEDLQVGSAAQACRAARWRLGRRRGWDPRRLVPRGGVAAASSRSWAGGHRGAAAGAPRGRGGWWPRDRRQQLPSGAAELAQRRDSSRFLPTRCGGRDRSFLTASGGGGAGTRRSFLNHSYRSWCCWVRLERRDKVAFLLGPTRTRGTRATRRLRSTLSLRRFFFLYCTFFQLFQM